MSREVWVDQDLCTSCGLCITNLPTAFRYADNRKAECFNANSVTEDEIKSQAIDICPVTCIHWLT